MFWGAADSWIEAMDGIGGLHRAKTCVEIDYIG